MTGQANWSDLPKRLGVGVIVAGVVFALMWIGGWPFTFLIALISAVLIWELVTMIESKANALPLAMFAAALLIGAAFLPQSLALILLALPVAVGFWRLRANQLLFAVFTGFIMIAAFGLIQMRASHGLPSLMWLAMVVIVTDIMGYFVGRRVGGPKFWARVSPNKTWSGTIGGWVGALVVGVFFMVWVGSGPFILAASVMLSLASQMGDIAESAVKRRMGVKDSSNLLPGHGGVFDRFDGVLGASVFVVVANLFVDFAPVMVG